MPLKNENKSNAVYNDFKVVWNAPCKKAKQSTTKEAKPLLVEKNEISSDEKGGFRILILAFYFPSPMDHRRLSGCHWYEMVNSLVIFRLRSVKIFDH